jgi:hypothetical protein
MTNWPVSEMRSESLSLTHVRAKVHVPIEVRRGESLSTLMYSFVDLCDSAEHLALVVDELARSHFRAATHYQSP